MGILVLSIIITSISYSSNSSSSSSSAFVQIDHPGAGSAQAPLLKTSGKDLWTSPSKGLQHLSKDLQCNDLWQTQGKDLAAFIEGRRMARAIGCLTFA